MNSSTSSGRLASSTSVERWKGRGGTATAITVLLVARLVVAILPFPRWRGTLGFSARLATSRAEALRLASQVERAAVRLPVESKCLPKAVALSWMLRRRKIGHAVVFAVRPRQTRTGVDTLHAWVEVEGDRVIGDLPGPWLETLRLGSS